MPVTVADKDAVGRSGASGPVILETKLARPSVRAEHVARRELLERLREGAGRKLTLLTAPPGFGKTTLLAEWAAAEDERAVAWLSLDEDDNDHARFFSYVIEALRTVEPAIGGRALAAHAAPGAELIDVVLPLLLNDLAALETGVVLVLDDYHVLTNAEIHEAVAYLVERLPESLRLVLATREDPPLPLGRLRVRGELCELRAGALRFSDEEARSFLNDLLDLGLSAEDVERLQARTEGWPAALYLAALSLRGRDDPSMVIDAFAGDDRHLVDYLTAEVLARQPAELRSFLLRTSILMRLCGPLCDAVADGDNSEKILEELERSNLLVMPLDTKREWYRYHPLFAELLQHELARTDADILPILHRRASAWYRQAGLIVEAARHATAAGDVDAAVELVGCCWPLFLEQGQLATVARWLEALPETVIAENWLLCLAGVTVAAHTDRLDEAERWLEAAERAPPLVRNGQQPYGPVAATRAFLRLSRGDIAGTIAAARHALTVAPSTELAWALAPQLVLGAALWWSGEATEAKAVLERAARTAQAAGLVPATIETLGFRAAIALDQGDAAQSDALAREAIELTRGAGLEEHPFTAMARIASGKAHARRGELTEAQDEIERGTELAERERSWLVTAYGLLALAEIRHRDHEPAAARRLLGRVRSMLKALPDPGTGLARVAQTEQTLRLRATRDGGSASTPFWELSERELAVLRLLAGRLSQREIAAELYVSFNTVKSHTRSIFRKLGAASRAEAVDRARELGLL
ncbi:MAG: LuxR C-terminal-related transcriptional regulator [Thermoleophilia bacterium]|nr:LuxR C-terminal-related transcriptional regulator [Thermoleophilia bacterium]MDH5280119.1 LuxR C-terminal-related transcriptional regulator [Thermoleophilia bacterium]